jgi:hypothetical protein
MQPDGLIGGMTQKDAKQEKQILDFDGSFPIIYFDADTHEAAKLVYKVALHTALWATGDGHGQVFPDEPDYVTSNS